MTIKRGRLWWFGHVERKDDADWLKRSMKMEFEGTWQKDVQGTPVGIVFVGTVSKRIWRVLACPVRMLRIGFTGD